MQQAGIVRLAGLSGTRAPVQPPSACSATQQAASDLLLRPPLDSPQVACSWSPTKFDRPQPSVSCNSRAFPPVTAGTDLLQAALLQLGPAHESLLDTH